jgi:predicted HicB family RNase H-like nuclease
MLTYKGYTAEIKVNVEAGMLQGRVLDIKDSITFEGKTVEEAKQEFHKSVDAYLKFCKELGQEADKPFSGKLPFRTTPEIHRAIYLAAAQAGKSINAWMEEVLKESAENAIGYRAFNFHEADSK